MVLHFHFTFKLFPGHAQKRERERKKERRESREPLLMTDHAIRKAKLAKIVQSFVHRNRPPRSPRSREAPRQLRSRDQRGASRDCSPSSNPENVCVSVFVCVSVVWQPRKCEKM